MRGGWSAVAWRVKWGERRTTFIGVGLLAVGLGLWVLLREDERQVEIAAKEPVEAKADATTVAVRSGGIHDDALVGGADIWYRYMSTLVESGGVIAVSVCNNDGYDVIRGSAGNDVFFAGGANPPP